MNKFVNFSYLSYSLYIKLPNYYIFGKNWGEPPVQRLKGGTGPPGPHHGPPMYGEVYGLYGEVNRLCTVYTRLYVYIY